MGRDRISLWDRITSGAGLACLAATLLLSVPSGVRVVRADEDDAKWMSVDPALEAPTAPPAAPSTSPPEATRPSRVAAAGEPEKANRPGIAGVEVEPGVIVLNTRGYNYGPPPQPPEPEALGYDSSKR